MDFVRAKIVKFLKKFYVESENYKEQLDFIADELMKMYEESDVNILGNFVRIENNDRGNDIEDFCSKLFSILCDRLLMDFDISDEDKKQLRLKLKKTCTNHRKLKKKAYTFFERDIGDIYKLIQEYIKSPDNYDVFAFKGELSNFFDLFYFKDEEGKCFDLIGMSQKDVLKMVVDKIANDKQVVENGIFDLKRQVLARSNNVVFHNLCVVLLQIISTKYPSKCLIFNEEKNREEIVRKMEEICQNARLDVLYDDLDWNFDCSDFEKDLLNIFDSLLRQYQRLKYPDVYDYQERFPKR